MRKNKTGCRDIPAARLVFPHDKVSAFDAAPAAPVRERKLRRI
jgi:hypothetical protein